MQLKTKQPFIERFLEVASSTPSAAALMSEGRLAYTYAELQAAAAELGLQLLSHGIGRGSVVGIVVPKSPEYIVSLIAVWLTGAAFVPIDKRLPRERIDFILEEARIHVVIDVPENGNTPEVVRIDSNSHTLHRAEAVRGTHICTNEIPEAKRGTDISGNDPTAEALRRSQTFRNSPTPAASLVDLNAISNTPTEGFTFPPAERNSRTTDSTEASRDRQVATSTLNKPWSPDELAYIIFTSGSTGVPKGVMVSHRGILNFLDAQIKGFYLSKNSRCLFFLSTNFDASISDIGTALLAGATLYFESESSLKAGPEFVRILDERGITHMDIPPSLLSLLDPAQMPDSLETVIIGGEACAPRVVRQWAKSFTVVNVYGPTEATVCTSFIECDADKWERPFIGDPIPNTEYLILSDDLEPVSAGDPGELFIAGIGLAIGYLNKPELTDRKFIARDGKRLYRTGDLVRQHESGDIEFLGRTDRQFKIRGMLIEPEEIEAQLKQHPNVHNAAVLKRPLADDGRDVLVAFVTARAQVQPSPQELRTYLSERLPKWMLPQHCELLANFPLTLTGKIDFAKLKSAELCRIAQTAGQSLRTETECAIAEIWRSVLSVDQVGPDDDFFDLGGDSFGVIEVSAAAETRGIKVTPALLMTHTKLYDLAAAIDSALQTKSDFETATAMRAEELRADVALTPEWLALLDEADRRADEFTPTPETVVLTGAAGFLGARLLHGLLQCRASRVYCIVRAKTREEALARIEKALARQHLKLSEAMASKIVPVCGDISRVCFGLSDLLWTELAERADTVFHCAAHVNMLSSYSSLRASNVVGTQEVIRLLCQGRRKELHYASTLSVFVATDQNTGIALETDDLSSTEVVYGGYAQSKWASEILLRSVEKRLQPIYHYRLGLITGDTKYGVSSDSDFLALFVRGLTALGCVPKAAPEIAVDITPIDFCAEAMLHVALNSHKVIGCNTFHIANPVSLSLIDLVRNMQACGIEIETVAPEVFLARAEPIIESNNAAASACFALCRCLPSQIFERHRSMDLFQATDIIFDSGNLRAALVGSDLSCPSPSDELIQLYIKNALAGSN